MMTAHRAGVRSILVHTGEAGRDGKWRCLADFECPSLTEAVDLVVRRWPLLRARALELAIDAGAGSVVLVGGLARSGKSTLAASLAAVLKEQGRAAVVVPLDCWLRGENDNRGVSVVDRYDLGAARAFLADARAVPGVKLVPRYDRLLRRSIPGGVEIEVPVDPILIVEGVPALADAGLRDLAARRIYVERPEQDRLREMVGNYRWRGWSEERIRALLAARGSEEVPFIEATSKFADVILKGFDHDCLQNAPAS